MFIKNSARRDKLLHDKEHRMLAVGGMFYWHFYLCCLGRSMVPYGYDAKATNYQQNDVNLGLMWKY